MAIGVSNLFLKRHSFISSRRTPDRQPFPAEMRPTAVKKGTQSDTIERPLFVFVFPLCSIMSPLCEGVDSFFGIDLTCSSADESAEELSTTYRRKLRHGVWSSNDAAWAKGLVERYNDITLSMLQCVSEDGNVDSSTHAKEQPAWPAARIPKIIHFIWLGSHLIPRHFRSEMDNNHAAEINKEIHLQEKEGWNACMRSWVNHHPPSSGWNVRLWTEKEVEATFLDTTSEYTMINRDAYEYALSKRNYGLASDVLRLEVLSTFGGVYVDIDYLCTAPFDDLHSAATFYCGASNVGCVEINNGLMGSAVGHKVTQMMIRKIGNWFGDNVEQEEAEAAPAVAASAFLSSFLDAETAQSLTKAKEMSHEDVIRHTGPGLITRVMMEVVATSREDGGSEGLAVADRIMVLPAKYFHSLPNTSRGSVSEFENVNEFCESNWCGNTTKAVHLWGCSWQK